MTPLDRLDPRYRVILCDIWGVVHDGAHLLPGVAFRFGQWRGEGRRIILLTNAPRPAATVARRLEEIGLPRQAYDGLMSSGEAGIEELVAPVRPVGFLGDADDRADLEARGVELVESGFRELACTGLDERDDDPADYAGRLRAWADADVLMHCLNPDRVVIHRGRREACAGALADVYEAMGGRVTWYGKPEPAIYDHALALAGNPPREAVLAIGDGLQTDILGAARYGLDAVFVSHGIHEGEPVPADFAERHGLGNWHPILTVEGIA